MTDAVPLFYAGVDGGGSKTLAVIVDAAGRERGRATAESSNYAAVGLERAVAEIRAAVTGAAVQAGASPPLGGAWVGLAGVDRDADKAAILPHLRWLAPEIRLGNDAELVLAGLPEGSGVAAIAGTGSIVLGRAPDGSTARAGGWGHVIGDEGSGYDLGRRALGAASRAADGRGPATALLDGILRHWDLSEPSGMIAPVYHDRAGDKTAIAQLAEVVFAAARDGDPVARRLVADAAAEIALGIGAVADRLGFGATPLPLALAGGILVGEAGFRASVLRRVRRRRPLERAVVVEDAAVCAALAAQREARP